MGAPRKSPAQQLRAHHLLKQGLGAGAITIQLEQEFDEPVKRRTVERWIEGFTEPESNEDSAFQWHQLEEIGIPWEASDWILSAWVRAKDGRGIPQFTPTARQVKWWYRVHRAIPDLDDRKVAFIAQRFVAREVAHVVLGEPLYLDDLTAWVSYRGWDSFDHVGSLSGHDRYLQAVEENRIPELKSRQWNWDLSTKVANERFDFDHFKFTLESFGFDSEHPELLPDQQMGILRGRRTDND